MALKTFGLWQDWEGFFVVRGETSIGTGVDRKDGGAVEELYLGAGGGPAGGGYLGAIRGTKRGSKGLVLSGRGRGAIRHHSLFEFSFSTIVSIEFASLLFSISRGSSSSGGIFYVADSIVKPIL